MLERELKFYIPNCQVDGLTQHVQQLSPRTQLLHAIYYDTQEAVLAGAKAALRLRLEGNQWVQTLKLAGPDELSTLELNHPVEQPELNLDLYRHHPQAAFLLELGPYLLPKYETHVTRQIVDLWHQDTKIELALDLGSIQSQGLQLAIQEIEFELIEGDVADLFTVGADWLSQHQLIIELRSKSERGTLLVAAATQHNDKAVTLEPAQYLAQSGFRLPPLSADTTGTLLSCYQDISSAYLSQVIRNAAFLARVDNLHASPAQQAEYLTLMRVGIRRLRAYRQLFQPWLSPTEKQLNRALRAHFRHFGVARDQDLLRLEVLPALRAAGLPETTPVPEPSTHPVDPSGLAASVAFQHCLLANLALLVTERTTVATSLSGEELSEALNQRLKTQFKRIQKRSRRFATLPPAQQHRLRNRIKNLSYCLEVLGSKKQAPLLAELQRIQRRLGKIMDVDVALRWCARHVQDDEQRGWALGWLTATRQQQSRRVLKRFKKLRALRFSGKERGH